MNSTYLMIGGGGGAVIESGIVSSISGASTLHHWDPQWENLGFLLCGAGHSSWELQRKTNTTWEGGELEGGERL